MLLHFPYVCTQNSHLTSPIHYTNQLMTHQQLHPNTTAITPPNHSYRFTVVEPATNLDVDGLTGLWPGDIHSGDPSARRGRWHWVAVRWAGALRKRYAAVEAGMAVGEAARLPRDTTLRGT